MWNSVAWMDDYTGGRGAHASVWSNSCEFKFLLAKSIIAHQEENRGKESLRKTKTLTRASRIWTREHPSHSLQGIKLFWERTKCLYSFYWCKRLEMKNNPKHDFLMLSLVFFLFGHDLYVRTNCKFSYFHCYWRCTAEAKKVKTEFKCLFVFYSELFVIPPPIIIIFSLLERYKFIKSQKSNGIQVLSQESTISKTKIKTKIKNRVLEHIIMLQWQFSK